jgi:hypothetical protein
MTFFLVQFSHGFKLTLPLGSAPFLNQHLKNLR